MLDPYQLKMVMTRSGRINFRKLRKESSSSKDRTFDQVGLRTDELRHFYILNFPILKLVLYWKLTIYWLCVLLAPKPVTNGFIEYWYA